MKCIKNKYLIYLIVYLTYAFSATSFFAEDPEKRLIFILFLSLIWLFTNPHIDKFIITVFLVYTLLVFAQATLYGGLVIKTYVTYFLFVILTPYLILKLIGLNFIRYYINVIVFFSLISLAFWLGSNLSPQFLQYIQTIPENYNTDLITFNGKQLNEQFIIYTIELSSQYGILRNAGQAWEPGAFAVFVVVALILNLLTGAKLSDKKNIILLITTLTTFSTAAYLSLGIILVYKSLKSHSSNQSKILVIPIIVFFVFYSFFSFEFLGNKIENQLEVASSSHMTESTSGRLFAARKDLLAITKYPIFGRGLHSETIKDLSVKEQGGYGFLNWAVKIGLICFTFFYYYTFLSFRLLEKITIPKNNDYIIYFLALIPLVFSQVVWNDLIFFILFFIYPINKKYYPKNIFAKPRLEPANS